MVNQLREKSERTKMLKMVYEKLIKVNYKIKIGEKW